MDLPPSGIARKHDPFNRTGGERQIGARWHRLVLVVCAALGPELSGAMEDMRLTGADGTVTGFFRFSRPDVAAPVTLAETDQMQLDFGAGLHLFVGDIMLWQPAHDRAAGITAGTPEDAISDLGGVLIYFSPSPQ